MYKTKADTKTSPARACFIGSKIQNRHTFCGKTRAPRSRKGILKRRLNKSLCRILMVIKVSGPTGGAGAGAAGIVVGMTEADLDVEIKSLIVADLLSVS